MASEDFSLLFCVPTALTSNEHLFSCTIKLNWHHLLPLP